MASVAYVNSTNTVELLGLSNRGVPLSGDAARVTLTVKDAAGAIVAGPTLMRYIDGSEGDYAGGFSHETALIVGAKYTAVIDADASDPGAELFAHWEMPFTAQTRKK